MQRPDANSPGCQQIEGTDGPRASSTELCRVGDAREGGRLTTEIAQLAQHASPHRPRSQRVE